MKETILKLKVITNAKKDKMGEMIGEWQKIYISAPPVENKANKRLINFLSRLYKTNKTNISIIKGEHTHFKIVKIVY